MRSKSRAAAKSNRISKVITMILLCGVFVATGIGQVGFAFNGVAPWYESGIAEAASWRIIPDGFDNKAFNEPITRGEFAEAVVLAYLSVRGELPGSWTPGSFSDGTNAFADVAMSLGIVSGYPDGSFRLDGAIKREEMFVMIHKLISQLDHVNAVEGTAVDAFTKQYNDTDKLSLWAVKAAAVMVDRKIISGTDKGMLEPKSKTTRAQALVILNNALNTVADEPVSGRTMARAVYKITGKDVADVNENTSNDTTNNDVTNNDASNTENTFSSLNYDAYLASLSTYNPSRGGRRDHRSLEEIYTPEQLMVMLGENSVKYALVFGSADAPRYQTADEALKHMVSVNFDAWAIGSNGAKTTVKRSVTVNKAIAETVKTIFKEIYEGPEKFPIKNVGAYAWRSSETSEHRWGLAIDINSNENYMIRTDGSVVAGSYWKPGVDPYSIKPDGDVVRAFKKYGFSWGGDAWSMSNDYMHFSFLGK